MFVIQVRERWQKHRTYEPYHDWEIYPASPWNYGVRPDPRDLGADGRDVATAFCGGERSDPVSNVRQKDSAMDDGDELGRHASAQSGGEPRKPGTTGTDPLRMREAADCLISGAAILNEPSMPKPRRCRALHLAGRGVSVSIAFG